MGGKCSIFHFTFAVVGSNIRINSLMCTIISFYDLGFFFGISITVFSVQDSDVN